jgi:large-conductance mechanosensitive channel
MTQTNKQKFAWSLWIPVILAFLIVSAAWFTLIKIAREHPTEVIELETPTSD